MAMTSMDPMVGSAILSEASGTRSRETVTLASGASVKANEVVGEITASGKYAPFDPAASDGTETAAGVVVAPSDATSADQPVLIIARDAEVDKNGLVWPDGITAAQQSAAEADLEAAGILVRG